MKKKILFIVILLATLVVFSSCGKETDAIKFKNEYESLNGTKSASGSTIRELAIEKDNPIIYKSAEDIVKMIENKETFVIYFGFAKCPWCRSVLPTLFEVSKDLKLEKLYYVDVLDIRDTIELDDNLSPVTKVKGTDAYYKLLEYLDNVLSDYTISTHSDKNDVVKPVTVGKRIYAPNVVGIVDGKAIEMTTGISSLQTDAYMDLTEEMINETYNKFKCVINCVLDNKNGTCSLDKAC